MVHKYSLDKSSKKHICPHCEKKRFVKYIDVTSNQYFNDGLGRCDRETSCGYHKKPFSNAQITYAPLTPKIVIKPNFHSNELVENSKKKYKNNAFIIFLSDYFSESEICKTIEKYNIGTSKHWEGATVFWQIDQLNNIHAGKVILFDKYTGKRIKEPYPHINWVHKITNQNNFTLQQCLFGLHLVANSLQKTIAIVESEKTAIIMSMFMPEYTWIATGSKQNLKYDFLKPLLKQKIIIFPDKGEFEDWDRKTKLLQKLGFKIKCSQLVENSSFEIGTDLADIYVHEFHSNNEKIQFSDTEKIIQQLAQINPEIWNLISTFDLIDNKGNGIRRVL